MRNRSPLPRFAAATVAAAGLVVGLLANTASAAQHPASPRPAAVAQAAKHAPQAPSLTGADTGAASDAAADRTTPVPATLRGAPVKLGSTAGSGAGATSSSTTGATAQHPAIRSEAAAHAAVARKAAVTSCTTADFSGRSGAALVSFIESVDPTACINPLFSLSGTTANAVFNETNMLTVANAVAKSASSYTGTDSTGLYELMYFMQAGYYVQYQPNSGVPAYDATLSNAVVSGLTTLFNTPHFGDVTDANGQVLGEAVVITDSAQVQGSFLNVYKKILNAYTSAWDASYYMDGFLNNVYTPLWNGNWNAAFVTAVTNDSSIVDTLNSFARNHSALLGGSNDALDSNAGNDLARMVGITALQTKIRPLAKGLLGFSSITGTTANLWVHVAYQADQYDASQCSYYGTCNLASELTAASLPNTYACDNRTIKSQSLSASDQAAVCQSLRNEVPFFENLDKVTGPIPGEYESNDVIAIWDSPFEYEVYSWVIYGNDTDNGGETLTGDPTDPNNVVVSVEYIKSPDDGFVAGVWNLNHEYTHVMQSIYDMKGDFGTQITVPDVWWIEGQAEYVSYSYRGVTDTEAVAEAAKHTYKLSQLFQNTYAIDDTTRTYPWGYLAVRYMFERHPADIYTMLADFRTGNYTGGYAVYNNIGTAYDADFDSWLTAVAAGGGTTTLPACSDPNPQAMGQNCSRANQAESAGNTDYLWIYLPAGTTTLTVSTAGGTGNAALYYDPDNWAGPSTYTASSTGSGTTQKITVTNAAAGYRYISLYAVTAFSGVTVSTQY
ncbi:microbial collagenase [Catenulispora sp. MAP12-49]|uniref:M9 family metallopeptidase n=1 Tax=Catenulispora sp. MAP12-49 TaxID=3156302 RepID=UPI0035124D8D